MYLQALHDVRHHFAAIKPGRGILCELIVLRLLAQSDGFRRFAAGRERDVAMDMGRVLRLVVKSSRSIEQWWGVLSELGAKLGSLGVTPEARAMFSEVVVQSLKDSAGATETQAQAWCAAIDAAWGGLACGMLRAKAARATMLAA